MAAATYTIEVQVDPLLSPEVLPDEVDEDPEQDEALIADLELELQLAHSTINDLRNEIEDLQERVNDLESE